ncbi:hypothetical protein ACQPXH_10875 [Nocardia sp. CA-135953]|uniref:hypothetical protein n=1 Tax=Nocardia sp. CA-135953 TaxID=3239978 RepID=UPI003D97A8EF
MRFSSIEVTDADAACTVFDINGDGKISVEELESLIRHVGAGLIDEPAESLLAAADTDGFRSPSAFRALLNFLSLTDSAREISTGLDLC